MVGRNITMLQPEPYCDHHEDYLRNYLQTGEARIIGIGREAEGRRKDGTVFPIHLSVSEMKLNGQRIFTGFVQDISARKAAEKKIQESEARLLEAQRIGHLGHWEWNIVDNELRWSEEIYRIFGLQPQEFDATYESFLDCVHPDDRPLVKAAVEKALQEKEPYSIDHRIILPDGSVRYVHERGEISCDPDGRPSRMLGTVHNITYYKEAEKKLKEREIFIRTVLNSLEFNVAVLDKAGVIIFVNDTWQDFARQNDGAADATGTGVNYLEICRSAAEQGDEYAAKALTGLQEIMAGSRERFDLEHPCDSPDEKRWFQMQMVQLPLPDGGIIASHLDITQRKQAADLLHNNAMALEWLVNKRTAELEVKTRQAETASRAKSELFSNMSHEFRTPLNAIIGFSDLLLASRDNPLTDLQKEWLGDIGSSGSRLLAMIEGMLKVARLDKEDIQPVSSEFDLGALLQESLDSQRLTDKPAMQTRLEMEEGLGAMKADAGKIQEVVDILVNNAFKFTPDGGTIVLAAQQLSIAEAKKLGFADRLAANVVKIAVTDNGIGIAGEDQGRLFRPFEQLDASLTKQYGGIGIGLFLASKLVALMDGILGVESEGRDKGCTFYFLVPLEPVT